jgi:parallel beta-helix repeat protein
MTHLRNRLSIIFLTLTAGALIAGPVLATDGVIEINQARALVGGVTSGDGAGFPVLIDSAGSYRLTGNLVAPASTEGIRVSASAVTLDLNGFSISGSGSGNLDGVIITAASNVEVRNGTIRDFPENGIRTTICAGCRVIDMRLLNNGWAGALMEDYALIRGCTASGNGNTGLYGRDSSSFINNVAHNNDFSGIYISGNGGGLIEGNTSYNNGWDGITGGISQTANGIVIRNNSSYGNTNHGIQSYGGTVVGNTTSGNDVDGINISASAARVQGNRSTGNGDDGIQSNGTSGVSVTDNVVTGNLYGLYLHADTTIGGNTATGNTTSDLAGGPGVRIACSNISGIQICP